MSTSGNKQDCTASIMVQVSISLIKIFFLHNNYILGILVTIKPHKRMKFSSDVFETLEEFFNQSVHIRRPATTEGRTTPHITYLVPKQILHEEYKKYAIKKWTMKGNPIESEKKYLGRTAFYNLLNSPLFRQQHALTCLCAQCFDGHEALTSLIALCESIGGISPFKFMPYSRSFLIFLISSILNIS